jgi:hypothetical protein
MVPDVPEVSERSNTVKASRFSVSEMRPVSATRIDEQGAAFRIV